jgi:hypothetical protein
MQRIDSTSDEKQLEELGRTGKEEIARKIK